MVSSIMGVLLHSVSYLGSVAFRVSCTRPLRANPQLLPFRKPFFAGRSVLIVLSDADGQGSLGIQLVDPSKGSAMGKVTVPQVHSPGITSIATDPIGTAAGHGGDGGELALVGSADGNASIWRFMSSHHLPLRPRILLQGHNGAKLSAVALCSLIQLAATVSCERYTCVCRFGSTENTPRVGLIQPGPPLRIPEDDKPSSYISGACHLTQSLKDYVASVVSLLTPSGDDDGQPTQRTEEIRQQKVLLLQWLKDCTPNLSVAISEQRFLSAVMLPFFLSLCPPTKAFDLKPALYHQSLQQLLALYCQDGRFAAELIPTLTVCMTHGGGRVHEEVLQSGTIHVLVSSLRLGLIRAAKFQIFSDSSSTRITTVEELIRHNSARVQAEEGNPSQSRQDGTAPKYIPPGIVQACVELVDACCGPAANTIDGLTPGAKVRWTSDVALTALFGFALDYDLWGATAQAAAPMTACVAERHGGSCVTAGYILRSQMSVQHFLDAIRLRFDSLPASRDLEATADSLSKVLQAMLLSSLLNRRSIAQGEHDIAACVGAMSDSSLGRCATHVILNAIVGILIMYEILPVEISIGRPQRVEPSQDRKIQVASRLGRNLLISQFHDVVAPMILLQTVFSRERTMLLKNSRTDSAEYDGSMCWQNHWGHALHAFTWVASIAGAEGIIASKSCGTIVGVRPCWIVKRCFR